MNRNIILFFLLTLSFRLFGQRFECTAVALREKTVTNSNIVIKFDKSGYLTIGKTKYHCTISHKAESGRGQYVYKTRYYEYFFFNDQKYKWIFIRQPNKNSTEKEVWYKIKEFKK